jgi:hypothetical protein
MKQTRTARRDLYWLPGAILFPFHDGRDKHTLIGAKAQMDCINSGSPIRLPASKMLDAPARVEKIKTIYKETHHEHRRCGQTEDDQGAAGQGSADVYRR